MVLVMKMETEGYKMYDGNCGVKEQASKISRSLSHQSLNSCRVNVLLPPTKRSKQNKNKNKSFVQHSCAHSTIFVEKLDRTAKHKSCACCLIFCLIFCLCQAKKPK